MFSEKRQCYLPFVRCSSAATTPKSREFIQMQMKLCHCRRQTKQKERERENIREREREINECKHKKAYNYQIIELISFMCSIILTQLTSILHFSADYGQYMMVVFVFFLRFSALRHKNAVANNLWPLCTNYIAIHRYGTLFRTAACSV